MKTRIFTLIVSLFITAMAFAYDVKIDGIYYNLDSNNKTAEVTYGYDYGKYSGNITIPSTILYLYNGETYRVTSIGGSAFQSCSSLTSITIPNSVTSIGGSAFQSCSSLTSITIPNSVTSIGSSAFSKCSSLTSITIPNSVTSIGDAAFHNCTSLTSITIPNSVTSIGGSAFQFCSSLTSITIPNSVTSIGEWAFSYCYALTSITIPNSVTSIGERAFAYCSSLTSITISNSVTSIGDEAFKYCSSLTSISIPNSVTSIGSSAFSNCSTLTSISIGSNVTSIGERVFDGCPTLSSVQWNVKKYNDFSENNTPFNYRKSGYTDYNIKGQITSFTFGDSVEYIPAYLCHNMGKLTSITIPNSVTSIGGSAFRGCSSLTSITIPNSVTSIVNWTFYDCSSLTSITIPNSVTSIGGSAFRGCSSLTSITIPNSVTSIGGSAFQSCSSLTSITIPNSVTSIGDYAFYKCDALTELKFNIDNLEGFVNRGINKLCYSAGISSVQRKLYKNGIEITELLMPETITTIPQYTFYKCKELSSVTIPNNVTSIERCAFYNCDKLRTLNIGSYVESIGSQAFDGCSAIYSINIDAIIPPIIESFTFYDVSRTAQIKVPCGSVDVYQASSYWNEFTNYIESPNTLSVEVNDNTMGMAVVTKQNTCTDITAIVQAQARPGYEFVKWSDGFTENPHTVFVMEDMTITAEFAPMAKEYNISVVCDATMGIVIGGGTYKEGESIIIEAIAKEGYHFVKWSDGNIENPRTIVVTEEVELTAEFKEDDKTMDDNVDESSVIVYVQDGVIYIEGADADYNVFDASGRLIYTGRDAQLQLPRGVYVIAVGGEVEKVVI